MTIIDIEDSETYLLPTINIDKLQMSLENFIILLLGSINNNKIESKTRFQKIFYLLNEEFQLSNNFKFFRYYYGPYSEILEQAVINLKFDDLLYEKIIYFNDFQSNYQISRGLTKKGINKFDILKRTYQDKIEDIKKMIKFLQENNFLEMDLKDLLKMVYIKVGYTK